MKTKEVKIKGVRYEAHYEKDGNDITVTALFFNDVDVTPIFDSLNIDVWPQIQEAIEDHECEREYERDYDMQRD